MALVRQLQRALVERGDDRRARNRPRYATSRPGRRCCPPDSRAVRVARAVRPADRLVAAVLARRVGRRAGGRARSTRWDLILWLLLGAIAMRGAGCVYNDIVDRDLDRAGRAHAQPAAGERRGVAARRRGSGWSRCAWSGSSCCSSSTLYAAIVALVSLAPVAAYPFMKRITWWPQAWLGHRLFLGGAGRLERRWRARSRCPGCCSMPGRSAG